MSNDHTRPRTRKHTRPLQLHAVFYNGTQYANV